MTVAKESGRPRLESVDLLRGVIMVVMALDHVRDYFAPGLNPGDVAHASYALFFTRWITNFCAPVFFLLTGTGAYLSLRKRTRGELSAFLFTRGAWLIFLEVTVYRCLGWQWNFDYHLTMLIVLWALGWSMIVLSALVWLPKWAVTTFGVVMIATHNLLDKMQISMSPSWWFEILHSPGFLMRRPGHVVLVLYPLIPWVGVTAAGYGLGQVFAWTAERRRRFLLMLGTAMSVAFVVLRWINHYGDPFTWEHQATGGRTVLAFLNTLKYPPSLLYLLMTLGPAMLILWAVDRGVPKMLKPAVTIGKVPFFYYLLHVPLIHLVALVVCFAKYHAGHWMFESDKPFQFPVATPPGWGFSLPVVYLVWICVVLALYPLCKWFAGVKQRRSDYWLSYF